MIVVKSSSYNIQAARILISSNPSASFIHWKQGDLSYGQFNLAYHDDKWDIGSCPKR